MAFIIANILPLETINELNEIFKLHICRINHIPQKWPEHDDFKFYDKLMKSNQEVVYERNTY